MSVWFGETWLCEAETCGFVNAVLRKCCRSCGAAYPGPMHPDPEINRAIQAEMEANFAQSAGASRAGTAARAVRPGFGSHD